ncbi:MAG: hypothetical protein M3N51_03375 [Actinomycetota bacterium]|nr:hypothetical protein [Actinomycetota bacterium]
MRARDRSLLTEVLPPEGRAVEAVVARYQRVAPAVTRFARSLADDEELRVRLGAQSSAARREVVIDPGLFQAAYARRAPVTPEEVALASALHEAVHLLVTDFEEARPLPQEWFPDRQVPQEPVPLLEALSEAAGPAGEALFLALEDARQERSHLSTYPGARSVLADMYLASVTRAMAEARPLGQYALACFLVAGGYQDVPTLQQSCAPHVALALNDAAAFLNAIPEAGGAWEVAGIALQLLAIARMHGLATDASPKETAGQKRNRQEQDREAVAGAVDEVRLISPVLRDVAGYDATRKAAEAMAGEDGRRAPAQVAGDAGTDQILRVSQAPTVYLPSGQGGKLLVTPVPERFAVFGQAGVEVLDVAARKWGVAQRHVSGELYPLFAANQRRGLRSGYDVGDLSPHAALFLGAGLYERMFERRALATRRSYAVSLLVDGSASMLQPRNLPGGSKAPWALAAATLGAWTLARLCDDLQVDFEVALFNRSFAAAPDDSERSFLDRLRRSQAGLRRSQGGAAERLSRTVNHYLVKSFEQRWRVAEEALAGLFWTAAEPAAAGAEARRAPELAPPVSMFEKAANVDEFNVSYAVERLARQRSQIRVLVVLADGMTRGSVEALAEAVGQAETSGTTILGIGIGDGTVQAAYGRSQVVERPEALTDAMVEGVRSALRRSLALWGSDTWWARASTNGSMHA